MSRACLRPISGLEVIERCLNRVHREEMVFADLSTKASEDLSGIAVATFYPAGTRLFAYQQAAGGVFVICGGRVDLFLSREQGKTMDFGILLKSGLGCNAPSNHNGRGEAHRRSHRGRHGYFDHPRPDPRASVLCPHEGACPAPRYLEALERLRIARGLKR